MKIMFASLGNKNKKIISRDDILNSLYGYTYFEKREKKINKKESTDVKSKKILKNNNGIRNSKFNITDKINGIFLEKPKSLVKNNKNTLNVKEKIDDIRKMHEFFYDSISKSSINHKHNEKNKEGKSRLYNNYIYDNEKNNECYSFSFFKSCILSVFIIAFLFFTIKNIGLVKNNILDLATNISVDKKQISAKELLKLYGIYNDSNYIINNEKVDVASEEKKDELIVSSDIELIDKDAILEDKTVFMNTQPKPNAVVTEQTKSLQRITLGTMKILNYSSTRSIDFNELLEKNITLTKASDKILLYNTHTSESYTNSDGYQFEYSGVMRSVDAKYNMLAIAKELNDNLRQKGFNSIQNTTPHDYGTYTSAYAKSRATVQEALSQMQGAGITIDVHRDAAANLAYRPVASVNGVQVCQLMFVMGVGSASVPNPNWKDNLALAIKIQLLADQIYPGLFRPMIIRNSVYNQDLNKYSLLVEFGATGNTIEEVKLSTRCLTNLINIIYKD